MTKYSHWGYKKNFQKNSYTPPLGPLCRAAWLYAGGVQLYAGVAWIYAKGAWLSYTIILLATTFCLKCPMAAHDI